MRLRRVVSRIFPATLLALPLVSCSGSSSDSPVLTAEMPLHLEDHLDAAIVVGSGVPAEVPEAVEWRFDELQPDWKPVVPGHGAEPVRLERTENALRLTLSEANGLDLWFSDAGDPQGGVYVDLPDWRREDWAYVLVRARASENVETIRFGFNLRSDAGEGTEYPWPWDFPGERINVVNDSSAQTYLLRADWSSGQWEGPWQQLVLWVDAGDSATVDLLSVSVIPKEANYASEPVGVREAVRNRSYRRSVYTHAPGRLEYRVRVPNAGRLDLGLGVLREDTPVTFRIAAAPDGAEAEVLLEETYADKERWAQRSVDLSGLAGRTVTLTLEAEAEKAGTVALWAAPTLTGGGEANRPNVIFYVIDGGGADYMSVYGYNRRTTPNLERLATEGALFEHAYSNSSWTYPSTASFMTSLQHSVLGGQRKWREPVPEEAVTMAQHFQRAGYQTGVFVANPNAGTLSGLQRGVDVFQEDWPEFAYFGGENHKDSSRYLHEGFWRWRETYPAEPYWVHFQSTDVHEDFPAVAPFSGLFVGPEQEKTWREWDERLGEEEGGHNVYSEAYEKTGISRVDFFAFHQGMYDETMAHNDYQIGRLVDRLKAEGEWENTLLIIGADHSIDAAMDDMGVAIQDSLPPEWVYAMLRPSISRVPLIFVWPGHIEGGQRFTEPVSMIDVLPTILDLVGLPMPEVMQGQSLAPLLLGTGDVEPRPVILDQLWLSRAGEVQGMIEVVDGRWGASLWIGPEEDKSEEQRRPTPLLLFDLWNDHWCVRPVNEEHPELVVKYTAFLEEQWEAHQNLAQQFTRSGEVELTPEQLETLRALGYIQ
ncbi:MAG: sulfatase [Acidimicrobiia bacterium]